ncbi:hypothetical protein GGI24_000299 [Coemansia furcata]|nr:hypothetical protein GGI24_000299 [Coemansia furcata]
MTRSKLSFLAAAWLLAAYQVEAGPIATAGDATSSELASLGGLLQALGAGVIGNGALIYPTAASSHQRAEAEILASDTATRVFKKVKSILKEGGLNEDEDGGEESAKSVTYLVKPALIFHKEEMAPPNPLVGNVLPLPGGALLYTPTPTAGANGEATSGPAASIKAAYGNLFAAAPYTPSYTLNKPHAAVIVEEVTDMISLKSMQQRLEDAGEDDSDGEDDEDEYGRKKKGHKSVKFVSLETIDSTSAFINPFTRADFPFGMITPTTKEEPKTTSRKTVKKMLSAKPTSTSASAQISASMGKDGGITLVGSNLTQSTAAPASATTIIIPPASLATSSSASPASSASPVSSSASPASSSSVSIHEESSKNDDVKANEVARIAHSPAMPDMGDATSVKGNRRDALSLDPLASSTGIAALAQSTLHESMEAAAATVGSSTEWHAESSATQAGEVPKHRKMHVVRVFEVKKNKSALISSSASAETSSGSLQKRDSLPLYDAPESTSMLESPMTYAPELMPSPAELMAGPAEVMPNQVEVMRSSMVPEPLAPTVGNLQRVAKEPEHDSDSDEEDEQGSKKIDSDAEKVSQILSMSRDNVSSAATSTAAVESTAESSSASVESSSVSAESSSASVESLSASVESSSASVESTGTASAASSSASVESSSASAASTSVSGDVKVEASSTSASGESASSTSVQSKATTSASAQSSSATAQSSSVSVKKGRTSSAMSTSRSLSIEDIGSEETSVEKDSASEEAKSEKDSDSDSESDGETGAEKERDASEEGDSGDSDNESEVAKDEESDDEASPRTKAEARERLAIVPGGDPFRAIQRVAAMGLREAEKAVEEFELHSDAPGIEALTTEDHPMATSAAPEATPALADASQSVVSALSAAMSSLGEHASETPIRADVNKDRDDDSDDDKDDEREEKEREGKSAKKDDSDSDSDADDKGKSAGSDSDSDDDSDSGSEKKKESRGEFDKEANAARKAVSDAAKESAQQVVKATELDGLATDSASADGADRIMSEAASEFAHQAVRATATELDDMATESAMTDAEFETHGGVNSDGEEVQFVTQLVPDEKEEKADRARANESPSIVVMASIDEEYEEDYDTKPHASAARRDSASDVVAPMGVQRMAVHAMNGDSYDEADRVRGVEPTPDLGIVKESQNRAINIGLGNLRRHV